MFETLTIESTTTHSVVTAQMEGNPFHIRAIVGTSGGRFIGASFVEVFRGNTVVPARAFCSDYGVEHGYQGEDAEALTALCRRMTADLSERYEITFLEREAEEDLEPEPEQIEPQEEAAGGE